MWVFFSSFLHWDLAHAKIYKFDFGIRGLVVKLASQTSSRIRAIGNVQAQPRRSDTCATV